MTDAQCVAIIASVLYGTCKSSVYSLSDALDDAESLLQDAERQVGESDDYDRRHSGGPSG